MTRASRIMRPYCPVGVPYLPRGPVAEAALLVVGLRIIMEIIHLHPYYMLVRLVKSLVYGGTCSFRLLKSIYA